MNKLSLIALASAALLAPVLSHAESTTINPAIAGSAASAKLDFTVVIPAVLYLRVGTGSGIAAANNTAVDSLTFTVPATNLGDSTAVAGVGGDLTAGAVTVRVFSNFGTNVSLNSSVSGQLSNGTDTIPWTQIGVVPAPLASTTAGYTNTGIAHPTFSATTGAGTAVSLAAGASKMVRQEGKWTFSYNNTSAYPAGTYGSTVGNNGRVTYTATQL